MQLMAKLACGGLWKRGPCDQGTWPDHRKVCPGGKTHKHTKIWEEQRFLGRSFYSWKPVFNIWWHFWNPSVHVNIAFQHIFFKCLEPSNNIQWFSWGHVKVSIERGPPTQPNWHVSLQFSLSKGQRNCFNEVFLSCLLFHILHRKKENVSLVQVIWIIFPRGQAFSGQ